MYPKYYFLYNELSESYNPYVILAEDSTSYTSILPISYFWLKNNNRMDLLNVLSVELSKAQFLNTNTHKDFGDRISFYEKNFGSIYSGFTITDQNSVFLNDYAIFLEHYMHNKKLDSELERIEKSLANYKLNNPDYIHAMGLFLSFLTKDNKEKILDERLKFLFSDKMMAFDKFIF